MLIAEGFDDVGGAALRTDAAVAVFGDANSSSGSDERGCGRNIERAAGVAAGAAGVDQGIFSELRPAHRALCR